MELHNFTCFTLRTDGLYLPTLFLHELAVAHSKASISWLSVIVFADTFVMKAPHQNETCAKSVKQLDYSINLHFSLLQTDGFCLPILFINELAVAHSKASISWNFVILFAKCFR